MKLTDDEQRMVEGTCGKALSMAMSILAKLGDIYGAEEMIPITQAHIDGCSYKAVGDAGLEFAEKLVDSGAKVFVPTTLNITARDIKRWQEFRVPPEFAEKSQRMEKAYLRMGAIPTWTCAPYLFGMVPHFGQQIAWAESNAIAFANSVIGARTARYGDFVDICAAIAGRIPEFGLHLAQNRRGEILLRLRTSQVDFGDDCAYPLIGYVTGSIAQERIPVIDGIPDAVTSDQLKALSAAAASSGAVGLFHILGVTPEAPTYEAAFQGKDPIQMTDIGEEELRKARQDLSTATEGRVNLVTIGCPHASFSEIERLIQLLDGRKISKGVEFWVHTNRTVYCWLKQIGLVDGLNSSGVKVTTDTCILNWPLDNWEFQLMVTNSAKFAHYAPGMTGIKVIFGNLKMCVDAALRGKARRP